MSHLEREEYLQGGGKYTSQTEEIHPPDRGNISPRRGKIISRQNASVAAGSECSVSRKVRM